MNNNRNIIENLLGILGLLTLVVIADQTLKKITKKTETKIISDDAVRVLQNPTKAKRLREAIDKYHETGDWSKTELENII